MRTKAWNDQDLREAVRKGTSIRSVLILLGLRPAGGNYVQVTRRIQHLNIKTDHFTGKGWSKGKRIAKKPVYDLKEILIRSSSFQSNKLKKRLFTAGLKRPVCEICGWHTARPDGSVPIELDHINGDRTDNRIENLRILCPNCHSLQDTHRGRNIGRYPLPG
jgi:5-methylcytosine-specific restriction endonuclease McrA